MYSIHIEECLVIKLFAEMANLLKDRDAKLQGLLYGSQLSKGGIFMKRLIKCLLSMLIVISLCATSVSASGPVEIINNNNGTITLKYNNVNHLQTKVIVTKTTQQSKTYYYDLKNGNNSAKIPLTLGNGTYTIMVCEQISGTKTYSVLSQDSVTQTLKPTRAAFKPTHIIISWKTTNAFIKKAKTLTKKDKTNYKRIQTIWKYLVKNYSYDYEKRDQIRSSATSYVPNISQVYKAKKGICYDMAALYSSMLRSVGIESKLVMGYTNKVEGYHAWNQVYNSKTKKWITIDVTYDMCLDKYNKKVSMVKKAKDYHTTSFVY